LPFDNKSELAVTIDLPEGSSVEATDRVAQAVARIVLDLPEVISCRPMPARRRRSTSTAWSATISCARNRNWATCDQLLTPKGDRDRTSHDIALDIRAAAEGAGRCPQAPASRWSSRRPARR
jgi:multidrug efflux pump subunit AcrB